MVHIASSLETLHFCTHAIFEITLLALLGGTDKYSYLNLSLYLYTPVKETARIYSVALGHVTRCARYSTFSVL